jgi:hypothetical protein
MRDFILDAVSAPSGSVPRLRQVPREWPDISLVCPLDWPSGGAAIGAIP